ERGKWLLDVGAVGQLRLAVEALVADSSTLAAAARLLLDLHFTPALEPLICDQAGLDLSAPETAEPGRRAPTVARRPRGGGFAEAVLRAYAYQCAMCCFDGKLGRNPVAIQAAHVHWHSAAAPTIWRMRWRSVPWIMCCSTSAWSASPRTGASPSLATTSQPRAAGRAVDALAGQPILDVRPGQASVDIIYIDWHRIQVFKGDHRPELPDRQARSDQLVVKQASRVPV